MQTILLIEDSPEIRDNMAEILELAGYTVLLAADGKAGVSIALSQKTDLIVCDVMMPELDGYGVINLLQKHDDTRHIPFIFVTARAERDEIRKGMDLGADDYITKPFTGTELLNAIDRRLLKARQGSSVGVVLDNEKRAGTPVSVLDVFEAEQEIRVFDKKQLIYREGQQPFRLYLLRTGRVKVYKTNEDGKDLIITVCHAGDHLGYNALLEDKAYSDTAEALEETEIASVSKAAFTSLMENPAIASDFIRLLAGNVREKENQLIGLAYNSLRKKVAEALLTLQEKFEKPGILPTVIHISRENIAALAGTAKESLIRTLGDFRDEGLISLSGSDITIADIRRLGQLIN